MRTPSPASILKSLALTALVLIAAWANPPARAQSPQSVRVRGTVLSLEGTALVVRSREGETVPIRLADTWAASGLVQASVAEIKPGTYIGTAAMPQAGGSLRALEVLIFPDALRGVGEGHFPWDLLPESTMTNATVTETVEAVNGRTLTLTYKGEQKTVTLPPGVPIVTSAPAQKTDLKAGAGVLISAQRQPDGSLTAARVTVGLNGVVPPI